MTRTDLFELIKKKNSYLCVGLDTDPEKLPAHLRSLPDPVFEFNKRIIDATAEFCVAYKPNIAFYESLGAEGWLSLKKTIDYLNQFKDEVFTIADAKRGDIGNTSSQYAKAFFEALPFDAVTVAPYMGEDSIRPFLDYENKWTIVLGLTSNEGSKDFEQLQFSDGEFLYEKVIKKISNWGTTENIMFVTGATKANDFEKIRDMIPNHFLLVPGVGSQGGSLKDVSTFGLNKDGGLLVNASRNIIYAGNKEDFAQEAKKIALQYQTEMSLYLP